MFGSKAGSRYHVATVTGCPSGRSVAITEGFGFVRKSRSSSGSGEVGMAAIPSGRNADGRVLVVAAEAGLLLVQRAERPEGEAAVAGTPPPAQLRMPVAERLDQRGLAGSLRWARLAAACSVLDSITVAPCAGYWPAGHAGCSPDLVF